MVAAVEIETKTCTRCNKELPATLEYFYKDRRAKCGLQSYCKVCDKVYRRSPTGRVSKKKADAKSYSAIRGYLQVVFSNMKRRCENPKHPQYKNYGGRGIKVCFESSEVFIRYVVDILQVDPRGTPPLQIDRINNEGNYERGNIRFISHKENCNNRLNNKKKQ